MRRKRPWSHAAIGRAQRKHDQRLARRQKVDGRSWQEPSRAEPNRYIRPIHIRSLCLAHSASSTLIGHWPPVSLPLAASLRVCISLVLSFVLIKSTISLICSRSFRYRGASRKSQGVGDEGRSTWLFRLLSFDQAQQTRVIPSGIFYGDLGNFCVDRWGKKNPNSVSQDKIRESPLLYNILFF